MTAKFTISLLLAGLLLAATGCKRPQNSPAEPAATPSQGTQGTAESQQGTRGTPSSEAKSEPKKPGWKLFKKKAPPVPLQIWNEFSGPNAFAHVKALVDLGPRTPGSPQLQQAREYLGNHLKKAGWEVQEQAFEELTPRGKTRFVNLIARFAGPPGGQKAASSTTQSILVASHYDSKIYEMIRFVGANDGGSSTGALLELARVLSLDPEMARKIELVFFDGEEAVSQFTETDGLYGSRYYANELRKSGRNAQFKLGILWDMIGDKELTITLSPDSPAALARGILASATALNLRDSFTYFDRNIYDDHVPLIEAGIPTIDLIDFDYLPWHTADDTLDKLSPESLQKVGSVTLHYLRTATGQ